MLPKNRIYHYPDQRNTGSIRIIDVTLPEGPIRIKRWKPSEGETEQSKDSVSISTEMLARVAAAMRPGHPINFDRVLGASYNTRSVLEALLLHTPEYYLCYPGRIDAYSNSVKEGHKHVIWLPDKPHRLGIIETTITDFIIREIQIEARYDAMQLPAESVQDDVAIDIARKHARMQIALLFIGAQFGFKSWIAQNDHSIRYQDKRLVEFDFVLNALEDAPYIQGSLDAMRAAKYIDCIWFLNTTHIPAVMEIEHSTGVISGLSRMRGLQKVMPAIQTRYVIVAPDELRNSVIEKANLPEHREIQARYFPYSAVEELYQLCQKRKPRGLSQEFLDSYMESIVET